MSDNRLSYKQLISGEHSFNRWLIVLIRRYILLLPLVLLLLIVFAYVYSWIDSFFDTESHSLLSAEGIRWSLRNGVRNFASAPIAKVLLLLISIGILWCSTFPRVLFRIIFRKVLTLKQRRAMTVALSVFAIYVIVLVVAIMSPHSILLSVRGTVEDGAFIGGLFMFVVFGITLLGTTYGVSSGTYRSHVDWIEGAGFLLSRTAYFFITAFLFSELMACLSFMHCSEFAHIVILYNTYEDWCYYILLTLFII